MQRELMSLLGLKQCSEGRRLSAQCRLEFPRNAYLAEACIVFTSGYLLGDGWLLKA